MIKFKKPKSFRSLEPSQKKASVGIRWFFLFLFLCLLGGVWAFFNYGLGDFFSDGQAEEMIINGDTLPPAPPLIDPIPEATNSAILEVSGRAEAFSELSLFLNGETIKKLAVEESGEFKISDININEGENNVFATTQDESGNQSQESVRQTITFDKEPPTLEIEFPESDQSFSGDQREIVIRGKTEDSAVITVNERKVVVGLDGGFEASYSLADGSNTIIIIAKDKAGNQAKEEMTISYRP